MVYVRMYGVFCFPEEFLELGLFCFVTHMQHMEMQHWQTVGKNQSCKSPGYLGCLLLLCCRFCV